MQVFLADQCQLRHFDAAGFEACMMGRRLFLIGMLHFPLPCSCSCTCMLCRVRLTVLMSLRELMTDRRLFIIGMLRLT